MMIIYKYMCLTSHCSQSLPQIYGMDNNGECETTRDNINDNALYGDGPDVSCAVSVIWERRIFISNRHLYSSLARPFPRHAALLVAEIHVTSW